MNQLNDMLYSDDYYKALKEAYKWPNWKKEFVNNCLFN